MINYIGGLAVPIRLREDRDFRFDVNELASLMNEGTKLIIINSPQNPTGGVLSRRDIQDIAEVIGDATSRCFPTRSTAASFSKENTIPLWRTPASRVGRFFSMDFRKPTR